MTPTQLNQISRSFRTERSRLSAATVQTLRARRLQAASRRAHRRAVKLMAEAFGVGSDVPQFDIKWARAQWFERLFRTGLVRL